MSTNCGDPAPIEDLSRSVTADEPTVGVIPFQPDVPELAALASGLSVETRNIASETAGLRVVSKETVGGLARTPLAIPDTILELGLDAVVEAGLGEVENELSLSVRIWTEGSRDPVWRGLYRGTADRLVRGAGQIVGQLRSIALGNRESRPLEEERACGQSPQICEIYLRALATIENRTDPATKAEVSKELTGALKQDPTFARAWAVLSRLDQPSEGGFAAAERAVELDPEAFEGYRALGLAWLARDRQRNALGLFQKAAQLAPSDSLSIRYLARIIGHLGDFAGSLPYAYRHALLNPKSAESHAYVGFTFVDLGDDERANTWLERALELDPHDTFTNAAHITQHLVNHRFEAARGLAQSMIVRSPEGPDGYLFAGLTSQMQGNDPEAAKYYVQATQLGIEDWQIRSFLLKHAGQDETAQKLVSEVREKGLTRIREGSDRMDPRLDVAYSYALSGDQERACEWLQSAIEVGWRYYRWARVDPGWVPLHGYPKFEKLLKEVETRIEQQRELLERLHLGCDPEDFSCISSSRHIPLDLDPKQQIQ